MGEEGKAIIHNVWILEKETGRTVFHEDFGSIKTQEDLLTGFLSAIYSFAEKEIGDEGIESMEMGKYILACHVSHGLLFVISADKEDKLSYLKVQVTLITNAFLEEFPTLSGQWKSFLKHWDGNRKIFQKFRPTLKDLMRSWTDVKTTTSIAEKMDLLEVYQQIFFRISKITFPLFRRGHIKQKLEEGLKNTLNKHQHVLNVEQLSNIYNSKETFLDILSVNIFNPELNVPTIKATLHSLCSTILEVLRKHLGDKKINEEFMNNVYPYIKQDWNRIRALGLDKTFIDYLS